MKIKIKNWLQNARELLLLVLVIFVLSAFFDVIAIEILKEDEEPLVAEAQELQNEQYDCQAEILEYLTEANPELEEFWVNTFTSENLNSDELIELAIEKYRRYISETKDVFESATSANTGDLLADVSEKNVVCAEMIDNYIAANEDLLVAQVTASSSAKKTVAILDEYKWINDRLRDMLSDVMYLKGDLTLMSDQVIFTKACIKE